MNLKEMLEIIEVDYPTEYALDFDNVGLLVGRLDKEVHTIYLAVDATDDVIEEAIQENADLLITHHPLIFGGMKRVNDQDFLGRRILLLIRNDISCYAMHTDYDVLKMADLAAEKLKLSDAKPLEVTGEFHGVTVGIGKTGDLKQTMTLRECADFVKKAFKIPDVRVFGDESQVIRTVAVCPGSGKSEISEAVGQHADVLIAGDFGHHDAIDAVSQGLCIIDAGHYATEYMFEADMKEYLESKFTNVSVKCAPTRFPYKTI